MRVKEIDIYKTKNHFIYSKDELTEKKGYQTSDNKLFTDKNEAEEHELKYQIEKWYRQLGGEDVLNHISIVIESRNISQWLIKHKNKIKRLLED